MSQPNQPAAEAFPAGNAPVITDAEKAQLDARAAGEPDPAAPPASAPVAADPPAAPVDAAASPAAQTPAPAQPNIPFIPAYQPPTRDFDQELRDVEAKIADLRQQRANGDLDGLSEDEYDQQLDTLRDQRADIRFESRAAADRAELAKQTSDQAWQWLQDQFFALEGNAAIRSDPALFSAWEAEMQAVVNKAAAESRSLSDWQLMNDARDGLVARGYPIAGAPRPSADTTPPPAKPDRTPPLGGLPQTLGGAPSAADPGTRPTASAMAEGDITDIERMMAGKSEAERDAILRGVPGSDFKMN